MPAYRVMTNQGEPKAKARSMLPQELGACWQQIPNKALFGVLLAVWLAFFHWLGNSTLGFIKSQSLFRWMHYVFSGSPDDAHGLLIPFVVLALLWWKRRELLAAPKGIWWPALALV